MWHNLIRKKTHLSVISFGWFFGLIVFICCNVMIGAFLNQWTSSPGTNLLWLAIGLILSCVILPLLLVNTSSYSCDQDIVLERRSNNYVTSFLVVCSTIMFLGSLSGFWILSRQGTGYAYPTNPQNFTILTVTLANGDFVGDRYYQSVIDLINTNSFDVISLQESMYGSIATGYDDVGRYISETLKMNTHYGGAYGRSGLTLISRYPIVYAYGGFFANTTATQSGFIYSKLAIGVNQYTVITAQLNGNSNDQITSVQQLLSLTHTIVNGTWTPLDHNNILLFGNFEFVPYSIPWNIITQVYIDSYASLNYTTTGYTRQCVNNSQTRSDYVFVFNNNDANFNVSWTVPLYKEEMFMYSIPLGSQISLNSSCPNC
jgi:endonuclease/exonuclease/phosphatase family metal-dependent hydrolase